MLANLLLLDVRPDPVPSGMGTAGLILIAFVVMMLSAAAIVGFVFLLRWLLRAKSPATQTAPYATPEFQANSPNQP